MYLLSRAFLKIADKNMDESDDLEYSDVPAHKGLDYDVNDD